jgi:hypothetical protein
MKIASFLIIVAAISCGCAIDKAQLARKSTVFGMQVQTPAPYQIVLQIGLIRSFDLVNPVNSNGVAAKFYSYVDADLKPIHQSAKETIDTK